jgi:transcriptional regulator
MDKINSVHLSTFDKIFQSSFINMAKKQLVPLEKVDKNGFLASYLAERSQREPEILELYNREIEQLTK